MLKNISEKDRERFRDEVVGRMIHRTRKGDAYFETFRRINLRGRKGR